MENIKNIKNTDPKSFNINQTIDISHIVNQFISTFYNLWLSNPSELKTRSIILHFPKIAHLNFKYSFTQRRH